MFCFSLKWNEYKIEIVYNVFIFYLIGKVEPGMPEISLPPFSIFYHNETLSFTKVCQELGSGIIVVPLVAVLANVAIAKAFSKLFYRSRKKKMKGHRLKLFII